jgi:hypothetical protein
MKTRKPYARHYIIRGHQALWRGDPAESGINTFSFVASIFKRTQAMKTIVVLVICSTFVLCQTNNVPAFYIKGQRLSIGMSQTEVATSLAQCCKLSPPLESEIEKKPYAKGRMVGHFIIPKEDSSFDILGGIFFVNGRVAKLTRPLGKDIDTSDEELVSFARVLKRALPDGTTTALVSVRHEQASNAETDIMVLSFPDGRGIEIDVGTLDKPNENTNKRDFVSIDEILEAQHY